MNRYDPHKNNGAVATEAAVLDAPHPAASTPPPAAAPAAAPAKTGGIKKLNFGAAAVKKTESKTAYPVFQDANGQAAIIAARIKRRVEELDALEGAIVTDKAELRLMVSPFYFNASTGKHDVPSSISVQSEAGEVLVSFQNRYAKVETDYGIVAVLGEERAAQFFRQAFELKIKGEKLPADEAQEIFDALSQVLADFNSAEAMEVTQSIKPTKEFHSARHLLLNVEENMAIEQACPIVVQIKTKGRGEPEK